MAALKILDSNRQIDLLLIDIVMPKDQPHGFALAPMARMKREEIKTAFMTAYRDIGVTDSDLGPIIYEPLDLGSLATTIGGFFGSAESSSSPVPPPSKC